jgi:hypothetical protein
MDDLKQADVESNSPSISNGGSSDLPDEVFIDPVMEKRITSKFDKFMMPQMALLMVIAYLDRSNIGVFLSPVLLNSSHELNNYRQRKNIWF